MAVPTQVFRLYRYQSPARCGHDLLVRVGRPGSSNADQGAADAAEDFADSTAEHLRAWWERWLLRRACPHEHTSRLVAEMQERPVGADLWGTGLRPIEVWTAAAEHGPPWAVIDTAPTEARFWQQVEADEGLLALRPRGPAELHHVYFITDHDGDTDLTYG